MFLEKPALGTHPHPKDYQCCHHQSAYTKCWELRARSTLYICDLVSSFKNKQISDHFPSTKTQPVNLVHKANQVVWLRPAFSFILSNNIAFLLTYVETEPCTTKMIRTDSQIENVGLLVSKAYILSQHTPKLPSAISVVRSTIWYISVIQAAALWSRALCLVHRCVFSTCHRTSR